MFLGFEETCEHITNLYTEKPPFVYVLVTPYVVVVWTLSVIVSLFTWFIGFWRCQGCSRVFSPFAKKKYVWSGGSREDGPNKYTYCVNCGKRHK